MSIANGIKLFEYLEKLALLNLSVKSNIKNLSVDEELYDLEDHNFLPVLDKIFLKNREVDEEKKDGVFLSIMRYSIEKMPKMPTELERWINIESVTFTKPEPIKKITINENFEDDIQRIDEFKKLAGSDPSSVLKKWITKNDDGEYKKIEKRDRDIFFEDYPELQSLYNDWIENKWKAWKEKNKEYLLANQAYDKFYALRSFLKTEMDSFDLLWSHDIVTWKKNNKEIYHPTFFTPIILEFDSESNTILFKQDPNSKTFFDVAFVREALEENSSNLADIDELAEHINSSTDFEVWDYELAHKYLQKLVRYISPEGESKYNDRNQKLNITSSPTAFNYHNIFLLKKTGKSWADYAKKIQEDITKNNTLTPFLEDLVGNTIVGEVNDPEDNTAAETPDLQDTELYFPLQFNEEQKQISKQIDSNYGSVVQGPPGTGKTHTIANLVSRFLAQGKTVLVTSQTGQALSVLKNKIPKEIRSLAVSQVEANSKNSDLQSSVSDINACLSDTTKYSEGKKEKKAVDLRRIREQIAQRNNEFEKKSLIDSKEELTIDIEKITPISAAKFIADFENCNKFKIRDAVLFDVELQISQKAIDEYLYLLQDLDPEIWSYHSLNKIPSIEKLPKIDTLKRFFELRKSLDKEDIALYHQYLPDNNKLDEIDQIKQYLEDYFRHEEKSRVFKDELTSLKGTLTTKQELTAIISKNTEAEVFELKKTLTKVNQILSSLNESWEKELLEICKNSHENERWQQLLEHIDKKIADYKNYDRVILGKNIKISNDYDIDFLKALEIIEKIRSDALKNGNRVKNGVIALLFKPKTRSFVKNIKINNKKIESLEDIDILNAFFSKLNAEEELQNLWEQTFSNLNNKKSLPKQFKMVDYELSIDNVKRIVNFERNHEELKNKVVAYGWINSFTIFNKDTIENAIILFDSFISLFKLKEYDQIFDNFKNELQGSNMHELVKKLHTEIDARNFVAIQEIKEKIKKLNERKLLSVEYSQLQKLVYNPEIEEIRNNKKNHKTVIQYIQDIELGNMDGIKDFIIALPTLIDKQNKSASLKLLENKVKEYLPKTVDAIKLHIKKKESENLQVEIEKNWKWQRLIAWLDHLHQGDDISEISKDIQRLKHQERDILKEIVAISAWMFLQSRITKPQKEALASFALSMKKYGKGTGKYASKHLRDAKNALEVGKDAVPVWIMPINTIHQLFPNPTAGMFDVVIFDEASQVDTRGLSIAYLGKKLLVVGDDEQVSPTSFTVQSKVSDLISRYISDIPNSTHFSSTSSLFDIAKIKMNDIVTLTEHFRSIEEIIGFSNALCYNGKLKVLRDQLPKYRLSPVLEGVFIETGYEETNGQVNKPEAEAVVKRLKELLIDPEYKETKEDSESRPITFGVISLLGKEQSKYITKLIGEEIDSKEIEKRNIVCGDPYVFQGDERDVILLSMVKAPDLQNPEKTITPYSASKKEYKQRINVAMSRAKNKMILFHSISKDTLTNPNDLRKMILDWFYNHKAEERKAGLQRVREEVERGRASEFEYEVAKIIINKGYNVIPQYEVANYRIDMVIQGENSKLAIECDGDQYHNNFDKWHEDIERQQILERSGWQFWRVTGSSFYKHKEKALTSLWQTLDELQIHPET